MASVPTKEMKLTEARAHLSEILNEVHRDGTRISITKSGLPIAAIISMRDLKRLQNFEQQREQDFEVLDEIGAGLTDVPWEEIEAQADRAVAALREVGVAERQGIQPPEPRRAVAEPDSPDYDKQPEDSRPDHHSHRGVA